MPDVIILGAGLAGLSCACELTSQGVSCQVLESSDGVGGRARTDVVDGFLLDRGFQVLLTAYPEAQRLLDYQALQLSSFLPGALVRLDGRFCPIADPWRQPSAALGTLVSPVGTLRDKLNITRLRRDVTKPPLEKLFQSKETSTMDFLVGYGFSPAIIERFFRPFFSGIFLDRELDTSSHMFEFVFRMFSLGHAALPASGMGSIARQLVKQLPLGAVQLQQRATKVGSHVVTLASGEERKAPVIVVAADYASANNLLPDMPRLGSRGATCLYFAAEKAPIKEPTLVLNGDGKGLINNLCVPSAVAPSYAPSGMHLVSATVVGQPRHIPDLQAAVRQQLAEWFGDEVRSWRHLRSYWIPDALPEQTPASGGIGPRENRLQPGLYSCGDYRDTSSINGAMASGRRTAEAIVGALGASAA